MTKEENELKTKPIHRAVITWVSEQANGVKCTAANGQPFDLKSKLLEVIPFLEIPVSKINPLQFVDLLNEAKGVSEGLISGWLDEELGPDPDLTDIVRIVKWLKDEINALKHPTGGAKPYEPTQAQTENLNKLHQSLCEMTQRSAQKAQSDHRDIIHALNVEAPCKCKLRSTAFGQTYCSAISKFLNMLEEEAEGKIKEVLSYDHVRDMYKPFFFFESKFLMYKKFCNDFVKELTLLIETPPRRVTK